MIYIIFGDSISYGAWDKEGGWVERLREKLDEKFFSNPKSWNLIYNVGISGDTTEDILERFEFETKQRIKEDSEVTFIFAIGANDSEFLHDKKDFKVPKNKFRKNIKKIIELARKYSDKIVFVGFTPAEDTKTDPIEWNKNISYINKYIKEYNDEIKSVCKENNVDFIKIFEDWMKKDYKKLLHEGIHPNSEGHKLIYEKVEKFLRKWK